MDKNKIFDGKSFEDLTKDIYENQKNRLSTLPIEIGQNHVRPNERISGKITSTGELSTNPSNSNGAFATG